MKFYHYLTVLSLVILLVTGCAEKTALIQASAKGDSQAVQTLIKEGANINQPDSNGVTPPRMRYGIMFDTAKYLDHLGQCKSQRQKRI